MPTDFNIMKIYLFRPLLFLILSFLSAGSFCQTTTLPADVVKSINLRLKETNPGIVIGIIDEGGSQYFSFGVTKKGGSKVNEHSIYEIGSISKVFTTALLADKVVKGELSVDDPIDRYLPSSVYVPTFENQPITLGHLSDHTSSLPRMPYNFTPADQDNPYVNYTADLMYDFLRTVELKRPVGAEYEYSNLAVGLLGHILAIQSGTSYEKLLQSVITGPLKMEETKIAFDQKMKRNLAIGHYQGSPVANWDLAVLEGAGGIRSSAYDMLKFISAQMGLTNTSLREAFDLTHIPRHDKAGNTQVGLGWHISKSFEGDIIWHNGATGGYTSFAGFNKETGKGVVVLTNSNASIDDIGFHLLDPDTPLKPVITHVSVLLKDIIDVEGCAGLVSGYDKIKKEHPDKYDYSESGLNELGYYYLNRKQFKDAQTVFLLAIREYPTSANVYDSYAESLMEDGQKEPAIEYYHKSLDINPGNINAIEMLAKMGVKKEFHSVKVDPVVLESYVGIYQLVPGFDITISRNDDRLLARATGQSEYEIFPKTDDEFYYKEVDAQIVFNKNDHGKVESLRLHQAGRDIVGKKMK